MKGIKGILLPILLLISIFPIQTFAAEEAVSYVIEGDVLEAEITGIDTSDKSQMVSISVVQSDAMEMPAKEDIAYANTIYTDGKDSLSLRINLDDIDIYSYHLVVNDKTGKIAYAQPLAVRTSLTITGAVLEEKIYDGTTEGKVKEVTFAETSELVLGTDYIAEAIYDSAEVGERTAVVTVTLMNTDKTSSYILESNTFELTGLTIHESKADKSAMYEKIAEAEKYNEEDYTFDSWNAFWEALVAVKEAAADEELLQSEADVVLKALDEALNSLEERKTLEIITQPANTSAAVGKDAAVSFEAAGDGLTYTWYYKNPGNVKFYKSGTQFVEEDTYTIPMYKWRDGQQVYCVVEDAYGNQKQTNTVTISVDNGSIVIVKDIADVTVETMGDEAVLTVEATGNGLTYQWYYKNPGNVKFYESADQFVSADGTTYTIPVARWRDGQQVYCVITDANGVSVQTSIVTLSAAK